MRKLESLTASKFQKFENNKITSGLVNIDGGINTLMGGRKDGYVCYDNCGYRMKSMGYTEYWTTADGCDYFIPNS